MNDQKKKICAVVLSAGRGRRMESVIQKQYMCLNGKPMIAHTLAAFERSCVDEIILVAGAGEEEYCRKEIVEAEGFRKVKTVVTGGKERYDSVFAGLKAASGCDYVLIHDGARPCVTEEIIRYAAVGAEQYGACVVGMPVKDTIKVADKEGYASRTPDRSYLWMVQTPQAFSYDLVYGAYEKLFREQEFTGVTDDAMVVERETSQKVKLIPGSYKNIKVTTPEDLAIAELYLKENAGR